MSLVMAVAVGPVAFITSDSRTSLVRRGDKVRVGFQDGQSKLYDIPGGMMAAVGTERAAQAACAIFGRDGFTEQARAAAEASAKLWHGKLGQHTLFACISRSAGQCVLHTFGSNPDHPRVAGAGVVLLPPHDMSAESARPRYDALCDAVATCKSLNGLVHALVATHAATYAELGPAGTVSADITIGMLRADGSRHVARGPVTDLPPNIMSVFGPYDPASARVVHEPPGIVE